MTTCHRGGVSPRFAGNEFFEIDVTRNAIAAVQDLRLDKGNEMLAQAERCVLAYPKSSHSQ